MDAVTTARFVAVHIAVSHHSLARETQTLVNLAVSHLLAQNLLKLTLTDIPR